MPSGAGYHQGLGAATVIATVARTALPASSTAIYREYYSMDDFMMGVLSDGTIRLGVISGSNYGDSASGVFAVGVHQYAMVFNGSQADNTGRLKLYKDGVQVSLSFTGTIPATLPSTLTTLRFGDDGAARLDGTIYDIRTWRRALTPAEIVYEALAPYGTPGKPRLNWFRSFRQTLPGIYSESGTVTLVGTVSGADLLHAIESGVIQIQGIISGDTWFTFAPETGTVLIDTILSGQDYKCLVESGTVYILCTVSGSDSQPTGRETGTVIIVGTVSGYDWSKPTKQWAGRVFIA
jgi:hypothetical protein